AEGAVERDASAERLNGLIARVRKACLRPEADTRSPRAEGEVRRMVELQRGGQVEASSLSYHKLAVEMRPSARRRKFDARTPDGLDRNGFVVCGRANSQLVVAGETGRAADFDPGRAGAHIRCECGPARLRADFGDRDCLDPMADAVDIQPHLVTGRDVGDGSH